jgi:hypothetical protein
MNFCKGICVFWIVFAAILLQWTAIFTDPRFHFHQTFYLLSEESEDRLLKRNGTHDHTPAFAVVLVSEITGDYLNQITPEAEGNLTDAMHSDHFIRNKMARAATKYYGNEDATSLLLKITKDFPGIRMAITGYFLDVEDFEEASKIAKKMSRVLSPQTTSKVQALELGVGPIVRGRLPFSWIDFYSSFYIHENKLTSSLRDELCDKNKNNRIFDIVQKEEGSRWLAVIVVLTMGYYHLDIVEFLSPEVIHNLEQAVKPFL